MRWSSKRRHTNRNKHLQVPNTNQILSNANQVPPNSDEHQPSHNDNVLHLSYISLFVYISQANRSLGVCSCIGSVSVILFLCFCVFVFVFCVFCFLFCVVLCIVYCVLCIICCVLCVFHAACVVELVDFHTTITLLPEILEARRRSLDTVESVQPMGWVWILSWVVLRQLRSSSFDSACSRRAWAVGRFVRLWVRLFVCFVLFCFVLFCFVLLCYVMLCYVMFCL